MYTCSLGDLISFTVLNSIYILQTPKFTPSAWTSALFDCLLDIYTWMSNGYLKLNMFKIELLISASLSKYRFLLQLATFSVNSSSMPPFAQNIKLSIILDSSLPQSPHLIHQQILVAPPANVFRIQLLITAFSAIIWV